MHLGVIGYGSITKTLIPLLTQTAVDRVSILVRNPPSAPSPEGLPVPVQIVTSLDALQSGMPDLVCECAGHSAVAHETRELLSHGTDVVIASIGALAKRDLQTSLDDATRASGARLLLPSGAIGGLDLLGALAAAGPVNVTYRGTKPPTTWKGTPAEQHLDLDSLTQAQDIFVGTARETALAFPKNANVVAALALAGGGFDRTRARLVADPAARGNQHAYDVTSRDCSYSMQIDNVPTAGNARTSATTVYSILRQIQSYRPASRN